MLVSAPTTRGGGQQVSAPTLEGHPPLGTYLLKRVPGTGRNRIGTALFEREQCQTPCIPLVLTASTWGEHPAFGTYQVLPQ
eukprot:217651-Amphidinium_carterae.1